MKKQSSVFLTFWGKLRTSVPKMYFPRTNVDISITFISFLFFVCIRIAAERYFEIMRGWDADSYRKMLISASVVSVTHALILVPSLGVLLFSQPYSMTSKMKDYPTVWQNAADALLQLCTGYMFNDILGLMMTNSWQYDSDDVPYIIHHTGTIIYMTLARVHGAGHMSAMTLMFSGEVTNPFQNIHTITKFWIQLETPGPLLHTIHVYVEFLHAVTYALVRLVVGPIQIIHITYALLFTRQGRENIPLWISALWLFIIWGLILGSLPWSFEALHMAMDGLHIKYDQNYNYCTGADFCRYQS